VSAYLTKLSTVSSHNRMIQISTVSINLRLNSDFR